jgi:hypothetical protein
LAKYFLVTVSFTAYIARLAYSGKMKTVGRVINKNKSQFISEFIVSDSEDREMARGNGVFV